jgi:hypothetical protein
MPVAVANAMTMPPVQMAVAHQSAMAVVMPMAVAAMIDLHQQVALGCCRFGKGGLRRDGGRRGRSKQRCRSYDGCCQGHLHQHGFNLILALASSGSLIRA